MTTKPLAMLLSAGALTIGVAACGSSSSPGSSGGSSTAASSTAAPAGSSGASDGRTGRSARAGNATAAGGTTRISLGVMGDMLKFDHSTLTARAGTVEIVFSNRSGEGHNVTVQKGHNGAVLGATPTFSSGTHQLTLHLAPGTYTYYCSVPGHREAGMVGTLKVT